MFSGLALLLIWLAVIGMLAHWVAGRRHEMAIRLALGASPGAMARTVLLRQGAMLVAAVALGLAASPLEKDVVGHLLTGVSALDARLWVAALGGMRGGARGCGDSRAEGSADRAGGDIAL